MLMSRFTNILKVYAVSIYTRKYILNTVSRCDL